MKVMSMAMMREPMSAAIGPRRTGDQHRHYKHHNESRF
jgi:hypothetical protein